MGLYRPSRAGPPGAARHASRARGLPDTAARRGAVSPRASRSRPSVGERRAPRPALRSDPPTRRPRDARRAPAPRTERRPPRGSGPRRGGLGCCEARGDVDDLVLLATDEPGRAAAQDDLRAGDAVAIGGVVGVAQEARVDPGVAHEEREARQARLLAHDREHDVLGDVEHREGADARSYPELVADRDERLRRGVAGSGPEAPGAAVDLARTRRDGDDGVRDAEVEVLVAVEADGRVGAELGAQ